MKRLWKLRFRALLLAMESRDWLRALATIVNRMNLGWQIRLVRVDRAKIKLERALFSHKTSLPVLVEGKGYYKRQVTPSKEKLADYYRDAYWNIRGGKSFGVNERDIAHFQLLSERLPDVISSGNTALNFGAGHGGISHLFWCAGMNVLNIEPSGLPNPYKERFSILGSLEAIADESVDLIYGCHSLEHVSDIEETKVLLNRKLKHPGWMFWQTPNAEMLRASQKEEFAMPTNKNFLFEARFFELWMENVLVNESVPDTEGNFLKSKPLRRVLGSVFSPDL